MNDKAREFFAKLPEEYNREAPIEYQGEIKVYDENIN